jgi:hypothetical protein
MLKEASKSLRPIPNEMLKGGIWERVHNDHTSDP